MLGGIRLKLAFTHEKTCFAYISSKYSTNNDQAQCIQVLYKDKQIYLWAVFTASIPEGHIACNPIFSRLVGLEEGCGVFASPYNDVKVLDELYIDTDSPDDQEILEYNADLLQLRILDQLRLVVANQKAIVWTSVSLPIIFTPKQTGLLVNHSRVVVKVDVFNSIHGNPKPTVTNVPQTENKYQNIGLVNKTMLSPYLNVPKRLVLRAVPIDGDGKKNLIHPYIVFIHNDLIDIKYVLNMVILATIKNIPSVASKHEGDTNAISDICVEIVPIDSVIFRSLSREIYNPNIPTVLIPKSLNAIINIENGKKLTFTMIGDQVEQPEHIDIETYTEEVQSEIDIIERFKNCVIENTHSGKRFLINDGIVKQNLQITSGFLKFKLKPERLKFTLLNSESFRHCSISAKTLTDIDSLLPKTVTSELEYDYKNYCRTMKSTQLLVDTIVSHIYFEIHRCSTFKGVSEVKSNVLLTGVSGTGKTALCHIVQKELTVCSRVLSCRPLCGRKDLTEELAKEIILCQEHSPGVLICDDIDCLVPSNLEGVSPQDVAYYERLATVIKRLLQKCEGVCVLMTSQSVHSLHPTLRKFVGRPMFTAHFDMPELQQEERVELLRHLINNKIREEFEVSEDDEVRMAMDTSGHTARDIVDYLNRKLFKCVKKKRLHSAEQKTPLIDEVTKDKEKHSGFDVWGPVGGLEDVKQKLTEIIFWPLMYPALFPSARGGILLYGPPGTGKSHLGSCLASARGLAFIHVKGPELLSKYIGQSEKAVREVFDKADMQRPCVVFFDEFDSLAPKRGHDSTGVTDRVVNQLLARLDGAEGGVRGPVLAATSRPDLLDPALLRAARLEHHLYCPLPDQRGRYDILRTLVKKVLVADQVDLQDISIRTEGFSPADLKALLVTAQLTRLENQLSKNEEKTMESVMVLKEDIESALEETKPSLSMEQRKFYDMIYRRFRGEPLSQEQRGMAMQFQKQRVTLA